MKTGTNTTNSARILLRVSGGENTASLNSSQWNSFADWFGEFLNEAIQHKGDPVEITDWYIDRITSEGAEVVYYYAPTSPEGLNYVNLDWFSMILGWIAENWESLVAVLITVYRIIRLLKNNQKMEAIGQDFRFCIHNDDGKPVLCYEPPIGGGNNGGNGGNNSNYSDSNTWLYIVILLVIMWYFNK